MFWRRGGWLFALFVAFAAMAWAPCASAAILAIPAELSASSWVASEDLCAAPGPVDPFLIMWHVSVSLGNLIEEKNYETVESFIGDVGHRGHRDGGPGVDCGQVR